VKPDLRAYAVCEPRHSLQGRKGPLLGQHQGQAALLSVSESVGERQIGAVALLLTGDDDEAAFVGGNRRTGLNLGPPNLSARPRSPQAEEQLLR
jgi:hypothetical protein